MTATGPIARFYQMIEGGSRPSEPTSRPVARYPSAPIVTAMRSHRQRALVGGCSRPPIFSSYGMAKRFSGTATDWMIGCPCSHRRNFPVNRRVSTLPPLLHYAAARHRSSLPSLTRVWCRSGPG